MSGLTGFALGLSAARSIKGQTLAGDNILFEPTNPVDITAPLICVYTGRGRSEFRDKELIFATDVRLRFEIFLPPAVTVSGVTLNTEASQALVFGIIWRQIEQALLIQQGAWPDVYREFLLRTVALAYERDLFEPAQGQKVPVAVYELHGETIAEPTIGMPPSGPWADLLNAMANDTAELASLAELMAELIVGIQNGLP